MRNPVSKAINAESTFYLEQFIEAKNILPTQSWAPTKDRLTNSCKSWIKSQTFLSRCITRNPKLLISF